MDVIILVLVFVMVGFVVMVAMVVSFQHVQTWSLARRALASHGKEVEARCQFMLSTLIFFHRQWKCPSHEGVS